MSDNIGKCPETIGYMGDVRNLSENRGIAIDDQAIVKWVKHSNGTRYATLFYSNDDVWHVGRQQQKLLKINSNLKFKQISNIKEFIDYVDTGMDRNEHPVKDITMINVYSTWEVEEGTRDYVEEARKRHEPEVRQVSREAVRELMGAMVINIFLSNKEANATKALTDKEVYQRVKDEYGWDQASAVKDEILNVSGIAKDGIDELKDKRELLTKGIKGLPDVKPQSILMKGAKYLGPIGELISTKDTIGKIEDAYSKQKYQQKLVEQCWKDAKNTKSKHFDDFGRCINLQKNTLINLEENMFNAVGYDAVSPKNLERIKKVISNEKK